MPLSDSVNIWGCRRSLMQWELVPGELYSVGASLQWELDPGELYGRWEPDSVGTLSSGSSLSICNVY